MEVADGSCIACAAQTSPIQNCLKEKKMTKPKVLISDSLSTQAVQVFEDAGVEATVVSKLSPDELADIIHEYDGLAVRSATKVTPQLLEKATNLKVVGRAGIGVDNIDVNACSTQGVVVMNTPFGNAITTAEHAIAMMFALARHIPQASESTHQGKWEKSKFKGVELTGKTLGVIGAGNIGSIVIRKALGLELKVLAYDPFLTEERAKAIGATKVELDELFARADIITLHVPKTPETTNVISADALNKMKKGVMLINCARGGLVDEVALAAALQNGHVAGAALDVFEVEPAKDNVLFGMPNVICTPHLGASTVEAQEKVAVQIAEQMSDFLLSGAVKNSLNTPNLSAEEAEVLEPYLELAKKLGSFAGQTTKDAIKKVKITFSGEDVADLNQRPIVYQLMQSLLSAQLVGVNLVNVKSVANKRGIKVEQSMSDADENYPTLLRLEVTTESRSRNLAGTLFNGKPRLVEIRGVKVESEFAPHMLYILNHDRPGAIALFGNTAAERQINITNMHLACAKGGDEAVALLDIDAPVDEATLEQLRASSLVIDARYVALGD